MTLVQVMQPLLSTLTRAELEDHVASLNSQLHDLLLWREQLGSAISKELLRNTKSRSTYQVLESIAKPIHQAAPVLKLPRQISNQGDLPLFSPPLLSPPVMEGRIPVGSKNNPFDLAPAPAQALILPIGHVANAVLNVIEEYGQHIGRTYGWPGRSKYKARVEIQIRKRQPIRFMLPAFPWKSVNTVDKVLGKTPDFGEYLALARLQTMCDDIIRVYPMGGEVSIATDGLLFDDLVGIPDDDTYDYSVALMDLASKHGFKSIKLLRVMDILGFTKGQIVTKEIYLSLTDKCRTTMLEKYGQTEEQVRRAMAKDPDTLRTYCGFVRFLEADLKHTAMAKSCPSGSQFRRNVKKTAIGMMIRAETFTKLLGGKFPHHVRLSIHPSTGTVKLSVPLILQADGTFPKSPWHSTIALGVDGSTRTVHAQEVKETHQLIHVDGKPWYYREKSPLWDWDCPRTEQLEFEPMYPSKLLIRPLEKRDEQKLLVLTEEQRNTLEKLKNEWQGMIEMDGIEDAP